MKIAVIGGGIFGSVVAWKLAESGHDVQIFEKESFLIGGTTSKSILRLHLGLHYPRDLETAIQSRQGYSRFLEEFGDSVDLGFDNYYAVAKNNSKVSTKSFIDFAKTAGIAISEKNPKDLKSFGFNYTKASSVFSAPEGTIDPRKLGAILDERIKSTSINVVLNSEISIAYFNKNNWTLYDVNDCRYGPFDFVIKATYGSDKIKILNTNPIDKSFEFHKTLVVRAKLGLADFGMTVVDGDFLTVLPDAFKTTHLLYGPSPSVLQKSSGKVVPPLFFNDDNYNLKLSSMQIMKRYADWFPDAPKPEHIDNLTGIRTIELGVEKTDRRVTEIYESAPKMISILSGKIDHCLYAANEILSVISKC